MLNQYLLALIQAANLPQVATWDAEMTRLLTAQPNWT